MAIGLMRSSKTMRFAAVIAIFLFLIIVSSAAHDEAATPRVKPAYGELPPAYKTPGMGGGGPGYGIGRKAVTGTATNHP
ncbi:uncharacterized protein G2W53_013118 [Senna tora]|uniref:Uncharacterized protein n=1 Tax=Senna tora TaxID=362788 RepID=A0A834U211_9FABA|nr:uncharacterized protein G2W53_013118 [Senna tora]